MRKKGGTGADQPTTQVYFPGEAGNLSDGIFNIRQTAFDFILTQR